MKAKTYWFESDDRVPLFVYEWAPDSYPLGIVHIARGLAEHAGRYARQAEALTDHGYLVYANDHRGHGKSSQRQAELGRFAFRDGWDRVATDMKLLIEMEGAQHAQLAVILLGH